MTRRILSMFVGLLLVAGTFTVLTAPAEARGVQLSLYNTGTRYVGQLVPMRGFMNYAGTKHNKTLLLQKFYKGKWYTIERKLNRANGGFRFRGRTYDQPMERYFRVVAKKHGKTHQGVEGRPGPREEAHRPHPADPAGRTPVRSPRMTPPLRRTTRPPRSRCWPTTPTPTATPSPSRGWARPTTASPPSSSGGVIYTPNAGYIGSDTLRLRDQRRQGRNRLGRGASHRDHSRRPAPGPTYTVNGQGQGRRSQLHPGVRRDQQRGDGNRHHLR